MLKLKKVLIMMVIMIITIACSLMLIAEEVKATEIDISDSIEITTDTNDTNDTNVTNDTNDVNNVNNTNTLNTQGSNTVTTNTTQTTTNAIENTLPKTGVTEDITVMFFIIVCAISAIYAYKKIRDYRI